MIPYQDVPRGGTPPGVGRLTQRQEWIWNWMLQFQKLNQRPPTVREIGEAAKIESKNGVSDQLKALIRKGFVCRGDRGKSRTLQALDPTYVPTEKGEAYVDRKRD